MSFAQKNRTCKNEEKNVIRRELFRIIATKMEDSLGTQKEHYGLRKIATKIKSSEIMLILFGIHTANVINFAKGESLSNLPLQSDVLYGKCNFREY